MNEPIDFIIRPAIETDIPQMTPFIVDCLTGPNGKTNYEVMFGISRLELLKMIKDLLVNPIPNHEFHFANYMLCEKNGEIISICCGWKESADLLGSENIRSNLIASYLGMDIWRSSFNRIKDFAELNIPRSPDFLYLENASTKNEYRRNNVAYKLVYELIRERKKEFPELEMIHSHVYLANKGMFDMFKRFQYKVEQINLTPKGSILNELFPVEGIALVSIPIKEYLELYEKNTNMKRTK